MVFRAPVSGFVIEKQALKGLHVMPGQSLYKVSDLSVVWVEADVYERDIDWRFTTRDARLKLKRLYPAILP